MRSTVFAVLHSIYVNIGQCVFMRYLPRFYIICLMINLLIVMAVMTFREFYTMVVPNEIECHWFLLEKGLLKSAEDNALVINAVMGSG